MLTPAHTVRDMSIKRPLTQEERHFNINWDDDQCLLTPRNNLTPPRERSNAEQVIADLQDGELFEDPEFPVGQSALYYSKTTDEIFEWKRPFELSPNPALYVDGTSRRDVIQGILGDCWLLSTCAAIAKTEDLIHRVLAPDQVHT